MAKPWPVNLSTTRLLVDANTPAPPIDYDTSNDTPPWSPPTRAAVLPRSTSDFGIQNSSSGQVDGETRSTRPLLQRSRTSPNHRPKTKRGGLAIGDLVDNKVQAEPVFARVYHNTLDMLMFRRPLFPLFRQRCCQSPRTSALTSDSQSMSQLMYSNILLLPLKLPSISSIVPDPLPQNRMSRLYGQVRNF